MTQTKQSKAKSDKTHKFVILTEHLEVKNSTYKRHDVISIVPGAYANILLTQRKIEKLRDFQNRKLSEAENPTPSTDNQHYRPKIDINGCPVDELQQINGVGRQKAIKIASSRPFDSVDSAIERYPVLANADLMMGA